MRARALWIALALQCTTAAVVVAQLPQLSPGDTVRVLDYRSVFDGGTRQLARGPLVAARGDTVIIGRSDGAALDTVVLDGRRAMDVRGRRSLWREGGMAGAVGGLVVGIIVGKSEEGTCPEHPVGGCWEFMAPVIGGLGGMSIGGLVGMGIGALIHVPAWKPVVDRGAGHTTLLGLSVAF